MMDEPLSVLISDDDAGFRDTIESLFESPRFRTRIAADGAEAIHIVRSEPVQLVLTDLHMPQASGLDVIREARQVHPGLPCILMSARIDDQVRSQAERIQVFTLLGKPIRLRELTGSIENVLQQVYHWSGRFRTGWAG